MNKDFQDLDCIYQAAEVPERVLGPGTLGHLGLAKLSDKVFGELATVRKELDVVGLLPWLQPVPGRQVDTCAGERSGVAHEEGAGWSVSPGDG